MKNSINDKRRSLAQETNVEQTARRFGRGLRKVVREPWRLLVLLAWEVALTVLWLWARARTGPLAVVGRALLVLFLAPLAVAVPAVLCWTWGGPLRANRVQRDLLRVGLVNAAGEPPVLVDMHKDPDHAKITVYVFYSRGIPSPVWLDNAGPIQSALNGTVIKIFEGTDNQHIDLHIAPPQSKLPVELPWYDRRLPVNHTVILLGESLVGPVNLDFAKTPHVLLAGATGSGKSELLKLMLRQSVLHGMDVYIADFKGGLDFGRRWRDACHVCYDLDGLLVMLDGLKANLKSRMEALRAADCANIEEYNQCEDRPTGPLRHIVFACDEAAEIFDKSGMSKADKEKVEQVVRNLSTIAREGRALGIHLILATQRPDADNIPGQIRSNLDTRICGRADKNLSIVSLGSAAADELLPKDVPGRFIINDRTGGTDGTVFQAYHMKKWR